MSDFISSLLSLVFFAFDFSSNAIVFVPSVCLVICFCFMFIRRLMRLVNV